MLPFSTEGVIYLIWVLWVLSWVIAALWSSRAQSRPGFVVEAAYRIVTAVGVIVLFFSASADHGWAARRFILPLPPVLTKPFWSLSAAGDWACIGLTVLGFAFTWWARIHLGTLWSGSITRKADHHIVDTGPYGLVRHPIYTGLILSALALAIVKATPAAFLGLAVTILGFWMKARFEEGFLRHELGPEAYDAYRKRVPMLAPFFPV